MGGSDERTGPLFSYVDLEERVRRDHPLRPIREIANAALAALSEDFAALYPPKLGRPSIPPERLLRATLLQAFYGKGQICFHGDDDANFIARRETSSTAC